MFFLPQQFPVGFDGLFVNETGDPFQLVVVEHAVQDPNPFNNLKDKSEYPIIVKISIDNVYAAIVAEECGINAIRISEYIQGSHNGNLCEVTGKFITPIMSRAIGYVKRKSDIPIIAGGIYSVDDAQSLLGDGAEAIVLDDSLRWYNFRLRSKIGKKIKTHGK